MFFIGADSNAAERVARSCASINYKPIFSIPNVVTTLSVARDPLMEGTVAAENVVPWFDTANPGANAFLQAVKRYAPGTVPLGGGMEGWVAAALFGEAAKNLSEPPTAESLLEGLWSLKDDDLGGMAPPLNFAKGQNHTLPFCFWPIQLRSGTFVSTNNFQRSCD
jgi:branched-chain amino acid transport system substrate-binding protein